MRKTLFFAFAGTLAALVVIVGVAIAFSADTGASANTAASPPRVPLGRTVVLYSPGSPAIQPRTQGTPAFTLADVAQYIRTKSFMTTTSGAAPTITTSEFITAQQASVLLKGESIGRPDNALVCFVLLQGPFHVKGPLPPGAVSPILKTGYELFDAHTGNLLMWGFFG